MKKLLAIILTVSFILSLTACSKKVDVGVKKADTKKEAQKTVASEIPQEIDLNEIKGFDDFVQKLDDSTLKPVVTENDDGSVTVELPTDKEDEIKPALPTIDKIAGTFFLISLFGVCTILCANATFSYTLRSFSKRKS